MPDLPFPFTQVQSWQEMVDTSQRYFEDLYQDRIGGALLGDVFVIGVDDVLAVNLGLGLTKANNELAVKNHATGGLTATADGEMVKCKADGGLSTDADGLYLVTGIKEGHIEGMQVTIKDSSNLYIWGGSIDINSVIYNATAQITFPTGTLTADTLYYLYVSAPGSGTTLAAAQFSLSTTGCTYDHAKAAYYQTGDGTKRWLANIKTAA